LFISAGSPAVPELGQRPAAGGIPGIAGGLIVHARSCAFVLLGKPDAFGRLGSTDALLASADSEAA
jgi:hypothetical protein